MDERRFTVTMEMCVTLQDVLDFLGCDESDYEPTDDEWLACARDLWESDEYVCMWSDVEEK